MDQAEFENWIGFLLLCTIVILLGSFDVDQIREGIAWLVR